MYVSKLILCCILLTSNMAQGSDPVKDESDKMADKTTRPPVGKLRKCCQRDQIYSKRKVCEPDRENRLAAFNWSERFARVDIEYNGRCSYKEYFLDEARNEFHEVFENGTLHQYDINEAGKVVWNKSHHPFNYCYDYVLDDRKLMPLICYGPEDEQQNSNQSMVLYGIYVSILFLLITLCLYLATPKLRCKTHDKCVLCHVVTLIIGFASLVGIHMVHLENVACTTLAYMTQFWNLASFFWLNVMGIDMWRSITTVDPFCQLSHLRFIFYCLYAWGCPLLVSSVTFLANKLLSADSNWRPNFGANSCWFPKYEGSQWLNPRFIYFYSFICLTLVWNMCIFVHTAFIIWLQNKKWGKQRSHDGRRHGRQQKQFFLYFNLFLVMGLNLFSEFISFYVDGKGGIWLIIDMTNALRGVFIFGIFVCNKRVLVLLQRRFFVDKIGLKQRELNRTISNYTRSTNTKSTDSTNSNIHMESMDKQLPFA